MIHVISCNPSCPWHRRGNKCRHPDCPNPNIAQQSDDMVPLLCPVRKNPQVIVVGDGVVPVLQGLSSNRAGFPRPSGGGGGVALSCEHLSSVIFSWV